MRFIVFGFDLIIAIIAWNLAFLLRFNFDFSDFLNSVALKTLPFTLIPQAAIWWFFGLYRGIWRYASLPDLKRLAASVSISVGAVALSFLFLQKLEGVPRSVWVLHGLLLTVGMGGARALYRLYKENLLFQSIGFSKSGEPVLILGAGSAAVNLLKDFARSKDWRVVGCLDDDPVKQGRIIYGTKVLGPISKVGPISKTKEIKKVILAIPSASLEQRKKILKACEGTGLEILTIPSVDELMSGLVNLNRIRKVEVEDLLGRDPIKLDTQGLHNLIFNKVVLVSGAGGSIGSELCRQIFEFQPRMLVFYEMNEFALYNLEQEFSQKIPSSLSGKQIPFVALAGDVRDSKRLDFVLATYKPDIVFHAAAYKHVPLMENHNAWEAVRTNVGGTLNVVQLTKVHKVAKLILISTDKAVNPTNVMGASKRLGEIVGQAFQPLTKTQIITVRFGNVLGSQGSVIPKFRDQISKGGPITVTHPEISRYFMSIPEACQLVLQAALMGAGGEIFVLDMGEPIKITELARTMIRLSGLDENSVPIVFSGLRPGEKLYEELFNDTEKVISTHHSKLRLAKSTEPIHLNTTVFLDWLQNPPDPPSDSWVRESLMRWVPGYIPSGDFVQDSKSNVHWINPQTKIRDS